MERKIKAEEKTAFTRQKAFSSVKEKIMNFKDAQALSGASESIKETLRLAAAPLVTFIMACAVTPASPALGTHPFGIALVCSANGFISALAALFGVALASFRMNSLGFIYTAVCAAVFFIRLFIGSVGIVKTGRYVMKGKVRRGRVRDSPFEESTYARLDAAFTASLGTNATVALGGALAAGIFGILTGGNLWYDVFSASLGIVLTPLLTLAYSAVGDPDVSAVVSKAGVGAAAYAVILSLSGVVLGGMNVAVILALAFTFWSAWCFGVSDGILFGFFVGIALDPSFSAMYAIAGASSGALFGFSLGVGCSCGAILAASWALYSDGISALSAVIPEIILASALFYPAAYFKVLPQNISFSSILPAGKKENERKGQKGSVSERLRSISDAMSHMSGVFMNLSKRLRFPGNAETLALCEESFAMVCTECAKKEICHHRENFSTQSAARKAAAALKENGKVDISAFSPTMARGCTKIDEVISGINEEYGKAFEAAARGDKTAVSAEDYAMMAELIRETLNDQDSEYGKNKVLCDKLAGEFSKNNVKYESMSVYGRSRPQVFVRGFDVRDLTYGAKDLERMAEKALGVSLTEPEMSIDYDKLNMYMECKKHFSIKHGRYSARSAGLEVNGDIAVSFNSNDDTFYMLICDGMGSGREAALTSRVSSLFLERMIGSGCPVNVAFMLLNEFTRKRRIECSTTIDLLKIDPFAKKGSFIKSGAAPSFVLRDRKLFRIESGTPPVGILDKPVAKETKFSLKDGDFVVMLSDGVIPDEEGEAWLYDVLGDPSLLKGDLSLSAERIVKESQRRCDRSDDSTVAIVSVTALEG